MRVRGWLVVVALGALAGCVSVATRPAVATAGEWAQWSDPGMAGFDDAAIESVRRSADETKSAAVMAVYRGNVLLAWGDVDRKLELHSVRKSLYSAMWGIAEARGLVDLQATIGELGVDDLEPLSEMEKQARLIDLLHARSGVYHPAAYTAGDDRAARPERGTHEPGSFFYYNNWDFNVAGVLLERITGEPLGVLFDEWIAKPLGMEDYEPGDVYAVLEPGQSRWPALTFRMSTRDLARFGQMWLDEGRWNGRQLLPAGWVKRASEPASELRPGQGYAMMWWTYDRGSIPGDRYPHASQVDIVQARGTGGQAIFVIPERDLVIVHRGDTDHGRRIDGGAIWTMVDQILGAQVEESATAGVTTALDPVPFASQLPERTWPEPLPLRADVLESLTGSYAFGPEVVGRIFLHDGRLFAYMPGEGEAELFAHSDRRFFLRIDPNVDVRFEGEGERPERVIVTMNGRELVGERIDTR